LAKLQQGSAAGEDALPWRASVAGEQVIREVLAIT